MNDDQYKKLMRRFTIAWFSVLVILLVIMLLSNRDKTSLRRYIDQKIESVAMQQAIPAAPQQPKDGYTPIKNVDYFDGRDGKDSVSTHAVIEKQTSVIEKIIEQVPVNGKDGKTLEIQFNPETRDLEKRYEGDDFWSVVIPCKVLIVGCEASE